MAQLLSESDAQALRELIAWWQRAQPQRERGGGTGRPLPGARDRGRSSQQITLMPAILTDSVLRSGSTTRWDYAWERAAGDRNNADLQALAAGFDVSSTVGTDAFARPAWNFYEYPSPANYENAGVGTGASLTRLAVPTPQPIILAVIHDPGGNTDGPSYWFSFLNPYSCAE